MTSRKLSNHGVNYLTETESLKLNKIEITLFKARIKTLLAILTLFSGVCLFVCMLRGGRIYLAMREKKTNVIKRREEKNDP